MKRSKEVEAILDMYIKDKIPINIIKESVYNKKSESGIIRRNLSYPDKFIATSWKYNCSFDEYILEQKESTSLGVIWLPITDILKPRRSHLPDWM
jgi:hypothetical protein